MVFNLMLLAKANIKKRVGMSAAFFLIIAVTILLSFTGFQLRAGFNHLYYQKVLETNSADFSAIMSKRIYDSHFEKIDSYLNEDRTIVQHESCDVLVWKNVNLQAGEDRSIYGTWLIRNADRKEVLSNLQLIEQLEKIPDNGIFVPYVCKTFFGYQLGETLKFVSENQSQEFIIAGFTEDILFGSRSFLAFDLPEEQFMIQKKMAGEGQTAAMVMIKSEESPSELAKRFTNFIAGLGDIDFYTSSDVSYAKNNRNSNMSIYIAIMSVAAAVGWIVCFCVIGFYMRNTLDQDLEEIGTLKSIGYTGISLTFTYILQFGVLSMFGAIAGIMVSKLIIYQVVDTIATDIGFVWREFPMMNSAVSRVLGTICLSGIMTFVCSAKIMRLKPSEAFQNSINSMPGKNISARIEQSPWNLNVAIALNKICFEPIKSLLLIIMMSIILFVSGFAVILYAKLAADSQGLRQITGAEIYSVNIQVEDHRKTNWLLEELKDYQEISKAMPAIDPGKFRLLCENESYASLGMFGDYDSLENPSIYQGRYPKHDNEAAVSGKLASELGKKIGDSIMVVQNFQETPITKEFLITGYTQGTYTGGLDIFLTEEGVKRINDRLEVDTIHLYLKPDINIDEFCGRLQDQFGDDMKYCGNFQALFETQFASIIKNVTALIWIVTSLMIAVVILMVFFLTKTIMLTQHRDFGIMKALGFSTGQMIHQISLVFLLYIAGGGLLGGAFLFFFLNRIIELMFFSMGVQKMNFQFPFLWVLFLIVFIGGISYLTAALSALNIRKITPCQMLQRE